MMRLTVAGLTAIIASVSAIQAESQADATAEWHYGGYGGYSNPWGGYYGGNSYGYGDSQVTKLQRDISYLVKQNSALKTKMTDAEARIAVLKENGTGSVDLSALEASVTALESKTGVNMDSIATNDGTIADLGTKVGDNEGDITVLDMMVCDNMSNIATNYDKIAANMMSIGVNSTSLANLSATTGTESAAIAMFVSDATTAIASNTALVAGNSAGIATNSAGIVTGNSLVGNLSSDVAALALVSTNPVFIAALSNGIAANAASIAGGVGQIPTMSTNAANAMSQIAANRATAALN